MDLLSSIESNDGGYDHLQIRGRSDPLQVIIAGKANFRVYERDPEKYKRDRNAAIQQFIDGNGVAAVTNSTRAAEFNEDATANQAADAGGFDAVRSTQIFGRIPLRLASTSSTIQLPLRPSSARMSSPESAYHNLSGASENNDVDVDMGDEIYEEGYEGEEGGEESEGESMDLDSD